MRAGPADPQHLGPPNRHKRASRWRTRRRTALAGSPSASGSVLAERLGSYKRLSDDSGTSGGLSVAARSCSHAGMTGKGVLQQPAFGDRRRCIQVPAVSKPTIASTLWTPRSARSEWRPGSGRRSRGAFGQGLRFAALRGPGVHVRPLGAHRFSRPSRAVARDQRGGSVSGQRTTLARPVKLRS